MTKFDRAGALATDRLLGAKAVSHITSLSRFTVYKLAKSGHFPAPRQIGPKRVAWKETDIIRWMDSRPTVKWAA